MRVAQILLVLGAISASSVVPFGAFAGPQPSTPAPNAQPEDDAWKAVNGLNEASLQSYLLAYPKSVHATEAKECIEIRKKIKDATIAKRLSKANGVTNLELGAGWTGWVRDSAKAFGTQDPLAGGLFLENDKGIIRPGIFVPVGGGASPATVYTQNNNTFASYKDQVYLGQLPPSLAPERANFDWIWMPTTEGSVVGFMTSGYEVHYLGIAIKTPKGATPNEALQFAVLRDLGWLYLRGSGVVTLPGGDARSFGSSENK